MGQHSFIMLKPDAMERHLEEEILAHFKRAGITPIRQKTVVVDEALILKHYADVIARVPIPDFKDRILSAFVGKEVKCFEMVSPLETTIEDIRTLLGPTDPVKADKTTLRGKYGMDSMEKSSQEKRMLMNLVHASDSVESAQAEIKLWFHEKNG